jgi:hypothetical protein
MGSLTDPKDGLTITLHSQEKRSPFAARLALGFCASRKKTHRISTLRSVVVPWRRHPGK